MSADLLREATDLMRQRANAADRGPWSVQALGNGCAWVDTPDFERAFPFHGFVDSARHVAAWHPAVALYVADWLEREARVWDHREQHGLTATHPSAVAVARAYLREDQP